MKYHKSLMENLTLGMLKADHNLKNVASSLLNSLTDDFEIEES